MLKTCPRISIKYLFTVTVFLLLLLPVILHTNIILAETSTEELEKEYDSVTKKLEKVSKKKDEISDKISKLASQLDVTQAQITEVQKELDSISKELTDINKNLSDLNASITEKTAVRNNMIRSYAKTYKVHDLELFLSFFRMDGLSYGFAKYVSSDLVNTITGLNKEIDSWEKDKKEAESLLAQMKSAQANLLAVKNKLSGDKTAAQRELSNIQKEIEELNAKQQSILAAKAGTETGSVGDYESPEGKTPDPPSNLGRPVFAAFSYGAYTHYNGMSQYGAKGRADEGDKYKDILKFYYKSGIKEQSGIDSKKISVQGFGSISFSYYLYGIAEMPTGWPIEALKAQAIAARTYAYKYTSGLKGTICTTQSCQVFSKSKADAVKSGKYPNWKKAVDDTADEILSENVSSQYSSTTGGYINNIGWDADGKWPGNAYEKKAGSPWFYKAWYTKSYSDNSTCGRSYPWLSSKEMADMLNTWVVWRKGSNSDRDNISPVTTGCWGGDPYSLDEMASKADKYGEKYSSVSNVSVEVSNSGYTSKVTLKTDQGTVSIAGDVFKTVFNLRAPSYIAIRSRLYDFEVR